MYLVVSIDDFVETVKRHDQRTPSRTVYRHSASLPNAGGGGVLGGSSGPTGYLLRLTYGNPETNLIVVAETLVGNQSEIGDLDYKMKQEGITVVSGMWTDGASLAAPAGQQPAAGGGPNGQFWVAAVAYNSADDEPGVWMDAFPTQPEEDEVLHAMFDEFVSSGDLADVSYEDFVSEAAPTVQVVAARDVQQWLRKRS